MTFAQAEEVVLGALQHVPHRGADLGGGRASPPKGVMLDTPERILPARRSEIALQAVHTHAMPPGNITEITPEERQVLAGVDRRRRQGGIAS